MSADAAPLAGERLFARYAHAPNSLGYCGPAGAQALQYAATGQPVDAQAVRRAAQQFSGAWPYQQLIGELVGLDALSVEVGRAYWTGSALTDEVDVTRFGELLLERFGRQAGHYWAHLTPDLLQEAAPTHAFHVFGVYPWTRLLSTGAPEPLQVLEGCRIRVGQVVDVNGSAIVVRTDRLTYTDGQLAVVDESNEVVSYRVEGDSFIGEPVLEGDLLAVHWGFACDRLTEEQAAYLQQSTRHQLDLTNHRLSTTHG